MILKRPSRSGVATSLAAGQARQGVVALSSAVIYGAFPFPHNGTPHVAHVALRGGRYTPERRRRDAEGTGADALMLDRCQMSCQIMC